MSTPKKVLASLLALLTVLPVLTACGSGSGTPSSDAGQTQPTETTSAAETTTVDNSPGSALPEYDGKGQKFVILCREEEPFNIEFAVESETGDVIEDAVYQRNRYVEEKLNVDIAPAVMKGHSAEYDKFIQTAVNSILAGDHAHHLVAGYTYRLAASSIDGNFTDWYTVPHVDFDQPWWADGFMEAASINKHSFLATGDLSTSYLQYTFALFFNKKLATDFNVGDLYQIVRDDEWTLAKMNEVAKDVSSDINGDGVMDFNDRWGFTVDRSTGLDGLLFAFEVPLSDRDDDGIPYIIGVTEKYQRVIEAVYELLFTSGIGFLDMKYDEHTTFRDDLTLFMPYRLYYANGFREMESDFGMIPYPKWDENQDEYHTYYADGCSSFVIPVTVPDLEFVGIVTELMAAKSYEMIRPAVYDVALKTKIARDDESAEMLDIILDSMIFEFTNIYANTFGSRKSPAHSLRAKMYEPSTDIASFFAANESLHNEIMKNLITAVTGE